TPSLPREIEADPDHEAIRARLAAPGRPLWAGGRVAVTVLPLGPSLASALGAAYRAGHLVLGLERAADALAAEAHGLALVGRRAARVRLRRGDGAGPRARPPARPVPPRRQCSACPSIVRRQGYGGTQGPVGDKSPNPNGRDRKQKTAAKTESAAQVKSKEDS